VSRIATGRFELRRTPGDFVKIIEEVMDSFRGAAARAGCRMTLRADGPIFGDWDHVRVAQILVNLLSNAVKFGAGNPIAISAARQQHEVALVVRDHGPGIELAALPRIFDRFERAGSIRHYGGLGLGLFLVREIALAHGGDVEAANEPGGGARIAVRLPLGAHDVSPTKARDGGRG